MNCLLILTMACLLYQKVASQVTTLADLDNELANLVDSYFERQSVIPVQSVTSAITVTAEFSLTAIKSINVEVGQIEISGYLTLTWADERFTPIAEDISVMVPSSKIWTPDVTLVNAVTSASDPSTYADVKFNMNTAEMVWKRWVYPTGVCKMDNYYFPFESHECTFRYGSLGYGSDRLVLSASSSTLDLSGFTENSEWSLEETSSSSYVENSLSYLQLTVKLKRKSTYTAGKILLPTILVALISTCTFLAPLTHSDRALFSVISVLLTFSLFLYNSALIPASSLSVPLMMYFLFAELIFSAIVTLLAIISVRIGSKSDKDPVPSWLKTFVSYLRCNFQTTNATNTITVLPANGDIKSPNKQGGRKKHSVTLESAWDEDATTESTNNENEERATGGNNANDNEMTWAQVGNTLDYLFMIFLLFMQLCMTAGIILPLGLH